MLFRRFYYSLSCRVNHCQSSGVHLSTSPTFKEQKIKLEKYEINYLRAGRGPHHVFCIPGALGTIWSSFRKQIEGFDGDKFTLLVWDPPGYGKSLALDDNEKSKIFSSDADTAYEFLKTLQIPKYSVLGWSNGGLVGLLLASRYPDVVNKVVAWGNATFLLPHETEYYKNMRNLDTWPKTMKEELIKLYGEENFIKKIDKLVEGMLEFSDSKKTYCDEVKRVRCPTFLLHGAKDPVLDIRHFKHLQSLLPNSRTHLYPDGKHNIHIKYADDFNKRVQEFLLTK